MTTTHGLEQLIQKVTTANAAEGMEKLDHSHIFGGNVKCHRKLAVSLQVKHTTIS